MMGLLQISIVMSGLKFFFLKLLLHLCVCVRVYLYAAACEWKSEDNYLHLGPGDQVEFVKLDDKRLLPLSHLSGPEPEFFMWVLEFWTEVFLHVHQVFFLMKPSTKPWLCCLVHLCEESRCFFIPALNVFFLCEDSGSSCFAPSHASDTRIKTTSVHVLIQRTLSPVYSVKQCFDPMPWVFLILF